LLFGDHFANFFVDGAAFVLAGSLTLLLVDGVGDSFTLPLLASAALLLEPHGALPVVDIVALLLVGHTAHLLVDSAALLLGVVGALLLVNSVGDGGALLLIDCLTVGGVAH